MSEAKPNFRDDPKAWHAAFLPRVEGYDKRLAENRAELAKFDAKREAERRKLEAEQAMELDKLRTDLLKELQEKDALLQEVAPIHKDDVESIPMLRAAYSDRTAALMAKIAMLTYIDFADAEKKTILNNMLEVGNVTLLETLAVDETEAVFAITSRFCVVAFRGTTSRQDVRTDLQAKLNSALVSVDHRPVKVHAGFYAAYKKVEARLEALLADPKCSDKPIYLTGHSLGGALALVASAALGGRKSFGDRIAAVYTFGCPRAGGRDFPLVVKAPHYRVVNGGDMVPFVPPSWLRGFVHTGTPILLTRNAKEPIRRNPRGSLLVFGIASLLLWPFTRQFLFLAAHDSSLYASRLHAIALKRKWG
jgi:triacylglycerol lipase